jgi:hypothetical protein
MNRLERKPCSQRRRPGTLSAVSATVALVLAASGCASQHSGASASRAAPPDCAVPSGPSTPGGQTAAARYLAIADAGNRHLETDFDRLEGPDHAQLGAAQADLRDAAATERLFDTCLLAITFPAQTEAVAHRLFTVNEERAALTAVAANSPSLARLASYEKQLTAADVPVEAMVTAIRAQLGLPPPPAS